MAPKVSDLSERLMAATSRRLGELVVLGACASGDRHAPVAQLDGDVPLASTEEARAGTGRAGGAVLRCSPPSRGRRGAGNPRVLPLDQIPVVEVAPGLGRTHHPARARCRRQAVGPLVLFVETAVRREAVESGLVVVVACGSGSVGRVTTLMLPAEVDNLDRQIGRRLRRPAVQPLPPNLPAPLPRAEATSRSTDDGRLPARRGRAL
jgi:hypothetical protein